MFRCVNDALNLVSFPKKSTSSPHPLFLPPAQYLHHPLRYTFQTPNTLAYVVRNTGAQQKPARKYRKLYDTAAGQNHLHGASTGEKRWR